MSRRQTPAPKRQGTTAADLFERLVAAFFRGQFPAGTPLREAALAREWNVSRPPWREAVRRASEAGFLVLRPNQAPLDRRGNSWLSDDLDWLYQFFRIIQHGMSANRVAVQHDYDDHRAILDALLAGNPTAAAKHLRYHIRHAGAVVTKTITNL